MKRIVFSSQFKKDAKLISKRRYNLEKLTVIVELLANNKPIPEKCRPHNPLCQASCPIHRSSHQSETTVASNTGMGLFTFKLLHYSLNGLLF